MITAHVWAQRNRTDTRLLSWVDNMVELAGLEHWVVF